MGKVTGAGSFSEQEGGVKSTGQAAQPEKGKAGGRAGFRDGQDGGLKGSEHQATFILPGLVFVSGCVSINTRTWLR